MWLVKCWSLPVDFYTCFALAWKLHFYGAGAEDLKIVSYCFELWKMWMNIEHPWWLFWASPSFHLLFTICKFVHFPSWTEMTCISIPLFTGLVMMVLTFLCYGLDISAYAFTCRWTFAIEQPLRNYSPRQSKACRFYCLFDSISWLLGTNVLLLSAHDWIQFSFPKEISS